MFWPGEFHGLHSPWGCKELDMTEGVPLLLSSKQSLKIDMFIIVLLFKVPFFKIRCFFFVVAQGGYNLVKL